MSKVRSPRLYTPALMPSRFARRVVPKVDGREKGAFAGALYKQRGRFERAHQGTIFLAEVGELSPDAQVRLLRVLQEKEIERVGGQESIKVDIRIVAATHRNLESMMAAGTFREDLYFRLMVFPIAVPPLRERRSDIPALVDHFIRKKSREMGFKGAPVVAPEAMARLMEWYWPGNVRELEYAVERALILNKGDTLYFEDIQSRSPEKKEARTPVSEPDILAFDSVVKQHLEQVLAVTGGRINGPGGAAELLKLNPSTLRQKLRKQGIPFGRKTRK